MKRSLPLPALNYIYVEDNEALESVYDYLFKLILDEESCNLTDGEL
jgi:hypothetical protein